MTKASLASLLALSLALPAVAALEGEDASDIKTCHVWAFNGGSSADDPSCPEGHKFINMWWGSLSAKLRSGGKRADLPTSVPFTGTLTALARATNGQSAQASCDFVAGVATAGGTECSFNLNRPSAGATWSFYCIGAQLSATSTKTSFGDGTCTFIWN